MDWGEVETKLNRESLPSRPVIEDPTAGTIVSYVVNYRAGEPVHAVVLAETGKGARFVANSVDAATVAAMQGAVVAGQPISVVPAEGLALHFSLD